MEQDEADIILDSMPIGIARKWCTNSSCFCMGAANCSGGAVSRGVTYEQWRSWMSRKQSDIYGDNITSYAYPRPKNDSILQEIKLFLLDGLPDNSKETRLIWQKRRDTLLERLKNILGE